VILLCRFQIHRGFDGVDQLCDIVHLLIAGHDTSSEKLIALLTWIVHQQLTGQLTNCTEICKRLAMMCRYILCFNQISYRF